MSLFGKKEEEKGSKYGKPVEEPEEDNEEESEYSSISVHFGDDSFDLEYNDSDWEMFKTAIKSGLIFESGDIIVNTKKVVYIERG